MLALHLCAAAAGEPPAHVRERLPAAQAAGSGQLTWFGLRAYRARLWVEPGFRRAGFAQHAFALELAYERAFASPQIARRSIEEMRRGGPLAEDHARRWQEQLERVLPDVRPGDRVTGLHRPGRGALFLVNGRAAGEIADPQFSERFFGIWLAPTSSEPRLREALLQGTPP